MIQRALSSQESPLYVVAIGAITNVASAILIEPAIIDHIVVVWLGGHVVTMESNQEFNLCGDLLASQYIFDCGVPLIHYALFRRDLPPPDDGSRSGSMPARKKCPVRYAVPPGSGLYQRSLWLGKGNLGCGRGGLSCQSRLV
ncbi:MAG: nucleoside hydrolase [Clostridia bacterium]